MSNKRECFLCRHPCKCATPTQPNPLETPAIAYLCITRIASLCRNPLLRMSYQYKREPLTPDEANRLASACETHQERLIVWTLLDTGLRVSELAGLTREHIDWQNHRLMIYGKGGIYGTKSKRRIIPLTDRIRPLIDGHFALHDTIGMAPRTIQRILKRIANKARINRPVSPHVLRHTFAVAAVQKGISLPALQRLLGHDRLTTTEIYLNLSPEDVIREFREKW
jgi:integrase/recombinase XerD